MSRRHFRVIHRGGVRGRRYYHDMPPTGEGFDFHELHPSSTQAYLDQFSKPLADDSSRDCVMALPKETRDQVFAHVGIMDLDAARCTCKTWWICITTNVWLLRLVLLSPDNPWILRHSDCNKSIEETVELRRLSIEFDKAAKALHHLHKDRSWKQNFRTVDVGFECSSSQLLEKQTIEWISYWNPVRVVILLVKLTPDLQGNITMTEEHKRIVFYSLDSCGRPVHLGTVSCPNYVNELEVVGLGHDVLSRSFHHPILLRSQCHTWRRVCTVEPRAHYAYTESFLKLTVLPVDDTQSASVFNDSYGLTGEYITNTEQYVAQLEAIRTRNILQRKHNSGQSLLLAAAKHDAHGAGIIEDRDAGRWILLREMDLTELYATDYPYLCSERLIVAKQITTQQLHFVIVRYVRDVDSILVKKSYTIEPKIHISAPKKQMVFQNLSVCYAGEQWCSEKFRMVISWVDPSCPISPGELYLYKFKPGDSLWYIKAQALRQIRISTVPLGVGGLHKESPLRQLQHSIWSSTDYTDGGLAVSPKVTSNLGIESNTGQFGPGPNAAISVQNGFQIVVTGVSKEDGKAYMRFLDLSPHFDDPWGSTLTDSTVPNGSKAVLTDLTNNRTYTRLTCTCPMHDLTYSVSLPESISGISDVLDEKNLQSMDDFRLVLPRSCEGLRPVFERDCYHRWNEARVKVKLSQLPQHVKDMLNVPGLLSRGWSEAPNLSSQGVDKGTVTQHTSTHRAAGLERLEQRGRLFIQKMRDDDLSDEEIANWWSNARWCWWNLLAKPAGWRRAAWEGGLGTFVL